MTARDAPRAPARRTPRARRNGSDDAARASPSRGGAPARRRALLAAVLACAGAAAAPARAAEPEADPAAAVPLGMHPPDREPPYFGYFAHLDFAAPVATRGLCPGSQACVMSGGAGLEVGVERRFPADVVLSAAYGLTLHDAGGVFEVSVLQWLGGRLTRTFLGDRRVHPYVTGGLGLVMFGDGLSVATVGGGLDLEVGVEVELDAAVRLRLSTPWRLFTLAPFTTRNDGVERATGFDVTVVSAFRVGVVVLELP